MAQIKYSSVVDEIRGKVGNSVFQRMGKCLGIRNSPYVNYSKNSDSVLSRTDFSRVAAAWQALSVYQKQTWVTVAPSYPAVDKFGSAILLTGYQVFMQVNLLLLSAGLPFVDVGYFYGQLIQPNILIGNIDVSASAFNVTVASSGYPTARAVVYSSDMYCSCTVDRNPKLSICRVIDCTLGAQVNLFADLQANCASPIVVGKAIFVEMWMVDGGTGIFGKIYSSFLPTVP